MKKQKVKKKRNFLAKELWTPKFRKQVVADKKKQANKDQCRKK